MYWHDMIYMHSYFHDISKSAIAIFATKIAVASQFVHEMRVSTKVFTQAFYSINKKWTVKKVGGKTKKKELLIEWMAIRDMPIILLLRIPWCTYQWM